MSLIILIVIKLYMIKNNYDCDYDKNDNMAMSVKFCFSGKIREWRVRQNYYADMQ